MSNSETIKIAIIDMNDGYPNQGMRSVQDILYRYRVYNQLQFDIDTFDLRQTNAIPDLSYDIYISTGGPGSPYDGENLPWELSFFNLLDQIDTHNLVATEKKHVFLICHSFQLACRKYNLGEVKLRQSTAFGIFPILLTKAGKAEATFKDLPSRFFSVDSRNWQVVNAKQEDFDAMGAKILAIERVRKDPNMERCIMAIRFSPYVIGTQFHPEADAIGMKLHLSTPEKEALIVKNYSAKRYKNMMDSLENPRRIMLTHSIILPNFLNNAIQQ